MKKDFIWNARGDVSLEQIAKNYDFYNPLGDSMYTSQGIEPPMNGFTAMRYDDGLTKRAAAALKAFGIDKMSYLGHGNFALVLKAGEDQVVRVSVDNVEPPRIVHPSILQPKKTIILQSEDDTPLRIEIMVQIKDKVGAIINEGISGEHIEKLRRALYASNLQPSDVIDNNVGLLPDGTPIVIDGGAVFMPKEGDILLDGPHLADWFATDASGKRDWKQHVFMPEIRQQTVSPSVISDTPAP